MTVTYISPLKYDKERVTYWVDMSSELMAGESLGSVKSVAAVVTLGTDPTPSAILDGSAISRTYVGVSIKNGVPGAMYRLEVVAVTSKGREIEAVIPVAVSVSPVVERIPLPFPGTDPVYRHTIQTTAIGATHNLIVGRIFAISPVDEPEVAGVIDWGDGSATEAINKVSGFLFLSHVYAAPGTYQVKITGVCHGLNTTQTANVRVLGVDNFGLVGLKQIQYTNEQFFTYVPVWLPPTINALSNTFRGNSTFNSPNVQVWDTSNVDTIALCFADCFEFNQPLAGWNTSKVVKAQQSFSGCRKFNQNLNGWNTLLMDSVSFMFSGCWELDQPFDNWRLPAATLLTGMFEHCRVLNQTFQSWQVGHILGMNSMFANCWKLDQSFSNWDVSVCTEFSATFAHCKVLNQDFNTWNTGAAVSMASMFCGAVKFNGNVDNWNTSNVELFQLMFAANEFFYDAPDGTMAFNRNIGSWNVTKARKMGQMFQDCRLFNQSLGSWNVANVDQFTAMFLRCTSFNQNLAAWRLTKCIDASQMISGRLVNVDNVDPLLMAFTSDVSAWGVTSAATNLAEMFMGCTSFNSNLSAWDVQNVTNFHQMFAYCLSFNGSLLTWNTAKGQFMAGMFLNNVNFNQPLSHFVTTALTDTRRMFSGAWTFDQNIGSWNMEKVTEAWEMFTGASLFNGAIGGWRFPLCTNMDRMFKDAFTFNRDCSTWCVPLIPVTPVDFATGATAWTLPQPPWGTCP